MLVDCKKTGGVIYNSGRIYIGAADSKKLLILKEKGYVSLEECEEVSKKKIYKFLNAVFTFKK